jgi:acid phosphatase (class A)
MSLPHRTFPILLLALTLSLPISLHAAPQEEFYVGASDLPPQLLPAPSVEGSAERKKEIAAVIAAQKHVSKSDHAAMRNEQHVRIELMTAAIGPDFSREKHPAAFTLLDHLFSDATAITEADKALWHTRRPYLTDRHVKLLVDPIDSSPAYPSGHTSETRVIAEVLGLLYPGRLEALRARAASIAWHRVEAGVHYPEDVKGGELLAMLIMGALIKNDTFQADLAAARKEITSESKQ